MNNKKTNHRQSFLAVLLAFALIISCMMPFGTVYADETQNEMAGTASNASLCDGTYEGSGKGRNGDVVVKVTIGDGVITKVDAVSQEETPSYWEDASAMLDRFTGRTSADGVDAVSGATLSSEGIRDAVKDALSKAAISEETTIPGTGTERDPFAISTADQMKLFSEKIDQGDAGYTEAFVVLRDNIDLSGIGNWDPAGIEGKVTQDETKLFAGTFDGRGFTISGMSINGEYNSEANIGLFSTLASTAKICNILIRDADIEAVSTGDYTPVRAGLIAGDTQSTPSSGGTVIDGCDVDGRVSVKANTSSAWGGGILGRSRKGAAIINCMSSAEISVSSVDSNNASYAGCIIGQSGNDNVLANCGATGNASASNRTSDKDSYAGGVAGMLSSRAYNIYALGNAEITKLEGGNDYAGTIAGQASGSSSGNLIYYASDASVKVNGKAADNAAFGVMDGSISDDSLIGMTRDGMSGRDFAEQLNSNIKSVKAALNESSLEMREWEMEGGRAVLTDSVWVPSEVDAGIFEGGTGTEADPYLIRTAGQLKAFAGSLNGRIDYSGKYIRLESDIDISGTDWTPVGESFYRFDGDFDGNGKVITGLTKGSAAEPAELDAAGTYTGLFGWISEHAHIHDLTLDRISIHTHSTGSAYVGGIAGRMSGSDTEGDYHGACIDGCTVKGTISHTSDKGTSFIGGIVGHMFKGMVINSMTDVNITAKELSGELIEAGGIAGLMNRGLAANSYALGSVTGSGYRDVKYDIEGMACVGNIAAVNGGSIVNCYGQGDVEALEYSIDTGVIAGWVTGIGKVYDCWYNEDANMKIDGRKVSPVDPFGETVAGGVSDEWGFRFPGSLLENNNGYHPAGGASKVAAGLNSSFEKFPIDIEGIYGLSKDSLKKWIVDDGQAVLGNSRATVKYVQPDVEKKVEEEPEQKMLDGTWWGRSDDKTTVVCIKVRDNEVSDAEVKRGTENTAAFDEAVERARFKARFGDTSDYEPADTGRFKGSGTEKDPYRVETEAQLRYLASSINEDVSWQGKYFLQTKDITVSGGEWTPVGWGIFADADEDGFGQDAVALYPFRGSYDGGGHTVKGLRAGSKGSPAGGNYMGMFGIVQGGYTTNEIPDDGFRTVLKNIRVEDVKFYTENRWRSYAGGLVANAQGGFTIDNCYVTGTVDSRSTEDFAFAGGLAGSLMYGSVTDTGTGVDSSAWSGKSYSYAGGLSGTSNRVTAVDSYTLGDVHADAGQTNRAEAGGFIALDGGVCINCYAKGNVESVSKYSMYVGGFTGMAASSSEHRQCYFNEDASQKIAGKDAEEKRYAGKFVNESVEANAQAQPGEVMSSSKFAELLENNRKKLPETLKQVRNTLDADESGSSKYQSVYYNGNGSDLGTWTLADDIVKPVKTIPADGQKDQVGNNSEAKRVKTVSVNTRTVTKKAVDKAVRKAGSSSKHVTGIILGRKVRKISKGAFAGYKNVRTITVRSKRLGKKSVKGSLKGSKVKTIKVKVGGRSANKKCANKYRKIFTKKNAGRKASVKY